MIPAREQVHVPVENDAFGIAGLLLDVRPELVVHLKDVLCHLTHVLDDLLAARLHAAGGNVFRDVAINVANEGCERRATIRTGSGVNHVCTEHENRLGRVREEWYGARVRDDVHATELDIDPADHNQLSFDEQRGTRLTHLSKTLA